MATFSTLDFGIDGGIARITLNRPDAANGISMQLAQELLQASLACRCSPQARHSPFAENVSPQVLGLTTRGCS